MRMRKKEESRLLKPTQPRPFQWSRNAPTMGDPPLQTVPAVQAGSLPLSFFYYYDFFSWKIK